MSHWTMRIERKLDEIDAALASARASIASTIEAAEGEAAHYRDEATRLREEVTRLRARVLLSTQALTMARPEIEVDVAAAREDGRAFHEKQIGDVLRAIDDALREVKS